MNKKALNLFFIFIISLFLVSVTYAADESQVTKTNHTITSDLSNDNIQALFDGANDGDTFEFTGSEYNDISLVVDKALNIISKNNSIIKVSNQVSEKAKSMGIDKTFGFYFTSNARGSVLSGITIIADGCDNAIIVNGADNMTISNNTIAGGDVGVLIENADELTLSNCDISRAVNDGVQLKDVKNTVLSEDNIYKNGRSGIKTSNIYDCQILNNTIHHNSFNGISMYDKSSGNLIKYNIVHNNTNGIYVNSESTNDVIYANTLSHNRCDPNFELGAYESGNGLLFGDKFRFKEDSTKLLVKNNALIHNEQFQAKNNPENPVFKLDQNWFDSDDGEHTFICPMLLAKILRLDTITIKNGIGLQVKDPDGKPITDMGTFDVPVEVNGNKYVVKVENNGVGELQIEDLDPNSEVDVDITLGDVQKQVIRKKAISGPEKYTKPTDSTNHNNNDNSESEDVNSGTNPDSGIGNGQGNGVGYGDGNGNSSSTDSHFANSGTTNKYGSNSSDIYSSDSSDNGENALSNGDQNAGSSSEGASGDSAKAYEIIPEKKISKSVVDTSGVVILSVLALVVMFAMGYRRKDEFE